MPAKKTTAKQLKTNKKEQIIKVDGRDYVISFNLGVLGELEDIYGDVNIALKEVQKGKVKAIIALIYSIMIQEEGNENLTIRKVGKMLDLKFIDEISSKAGKAIKNDLGESEETTKDELGEK